MLSRLSRLVRTFTFRLALVYVALFGISVMMLFGFIYTFANNYLENQITDAVRLRHSLLVDEYRGSGSTALEQRIAEMMASDDEGAEIYLLINNKGEKLAGNLNEWPQNPVHEGALDKDASWVSFSIEGTRNHPESITVHAVTVQLSKWRSLLVGETMLAKRKVKQTILQTLAASLALTVLMAFVGAAVMTRSVIRRLSVINRSAHTIMHGDIATRIPFTRGGDEFDELSHNLNRMLDRIAQLLESLGQFANNIAHDLRSPLNRIVTRTEAGLRGLKEQSAARKLLEKNVEDMQELIATFNSILRISELESNAGFRSFEECDLTWIIERLSDFYEPLAAEKSVVLKNMLNRPLLVRGEKNLLTQAFANLLDNAIKFTPEGGNVSISYKLGEDSTTILIADTGAGIPADYREKVFEKFFRLEASRHTRGNGLGLSLVAAIARIHGAEIRLEDNEPGLRVEITFH